MHRRRRDRPAGVAAAPAARTTWRDIALVGICVGVWLVCAIAPVDYEAWLLEQVATLIGLACLYQLGKRTTFSPAAKIGMAVLFIIHTIGTHFTYSLTPYDELFEYLFGFSLNDALNWRRNHYDRFVHLMYGACVTLPLIELMRQRLGAANGPARWLALHVIVSTSAIYELLEWLAALVFGGDLGAHYLGTQGDIWDAQADIALGGLGSLGAIAGSAVRARTVGNRASSGPGTQGSLGNASANPSSERGSDLARKRQ